MLSSAGTKAQARRSKPPHLALFQLHSTAMSSSFHEDLASSPSSLSPLPYFDDDNNVERYYDNESNNKQEQDVQHFENNPVMGKSNELNAFMMQESRSATINLSNDNDHDEVDSVLDRNLKIEWMRQRVEAQLAALTKGADICLLRKQVEELRSHDSIHPNEYNSNNNEINTTLDPTSRKINSIICTQDKSTEAKANRRGNTTSSNISGNNANAPLAVAIAVETTNPEIAIDLLATAVPLSETNFPQIRTARTIHVPMTTEQDQDLEPLPLTPITKKDQELLTAADMTSFHLDDDEVQVVDSQGNPLDPFPNSSQSTFSNTDLGHLSQPSTNAPLPVAKNRCTQSSSYVERLSMTDLYGDAGIYTGELLQLKPHGLGEMHYNDGRVFSGGWNKGKWHGKGRSFFTGTGAFLPFAKTSTFDTFLPNCLDQVDNSQAVLIACNLFHHLSLVATTTPTLTPQELQSLSMAISLMVRMIWIEDMDSVFTNGRMVESMRVNSIMTNVKDVGKFESLTTTSWMICQL